MARLTFDQIVAQGMVIGQNDAITSWVGIKLKAWLRKHYADYPWPWLIQQATGISFGASDYNGKAVGAGSGGLSLQISRIFSPIYYRPSGSFSGRNSAPLRTIVGDDSQRAIGMLDSSNQKGPPTSFIALPAYSNNTGKLAMVLYSFPVPDQTYTIAFTYQVLPDDPAGTDVPIYPNEMTLIQAAKVAALEYDQTNDPVYDKEAATLASMVVADRSTYGGTPSFGDFMQLDSSVFLP